MLKQVLIVMAALGAGACDREPAPRGRGLIAAAVASAASPLGDCAALARKLCAEFGQGSETCSMVQAQTERFRAEACARLLGDYAHTLDQLKRREEAQHAVAQPDQSYSRGPIPSFGPVYSDVTLVEFSAFTSVDCGRGSGIARSVKNLHGDDVRFIFRQLPDPKHPAARLAAEASLAAHAQGKFWEYHDTLFANPHDLSRQALERYAQGVGLNPEEFRHALDEKRYAADVAEDVRLAESLLVDGLPALFVNGRRVPFPFGVPELEKVIAEARGQK